ncbi:MAG TPA: HlyD family efflux transporter periplasmic adaptor subunit [Trichormus sp.]|jgi:HlyD family secretion protein
MTDSDSHTSVQKSQQATRGGDEQQKTVAKHKRRNPKVVLIPAVLLLVLAIVAFQWWRNRPEGKSGWLRCSGRIEGYEVNVGAKIAGRVEFISNREGEEVKPGRLLVKLSDDDIQAQLRGAKARVNEAQKSVSEAEEQKKASEQQVEQARLSVEQSRQDAKGRVDQAEANVAEAEANVSQARAQEVEAKANLELASVRKKRYHDLVLKGAVTQDEDDQAATTYEAAVATTQARRDGVVASERQLKSLQAALMQAKSNTLNPPIRTTQKQANMRTVAQNQAALERAKEDVKNAASSVDEIRANIAYLNIPSPIHGVVTARTVEPGAVVAAGQTVISLINLDTVFLRAYVPDSQIGKVRINQPALVYYDSDPKHGVQGKVIEIDPEASFTPENIYFRDDRVKQVFGIKIMIDNPSNYAKPGMPADADIDIQSQAQEKRS